MTAGLSQPQNRVTVSAGGVSWGVWDKLTGGDIEAEVQTYSPGGMAEKVVLSAPQSFSDMTISRIYDGGLAPALIRDAGAGGEVVVTRQTLNDRKQAEGPAVVYRGRLKGVKLPDVDSEGSDAALMEITVAVASVTAAA